MLSALRLILILGIFLLIGQTAWAQRVSNWRVFKASDGLADSFVSSVNIGQRTNIWVWHSEVNAASSLNGYQIKNYPTPHSGTSRIYESRAGQIWAPYSRGLQEFRNGVWTLYPIKEIEQEYQANLIRNVRPLSLVPLRQGLVLFLISEHLMELNNERPPQMTTTSVLPVEKTSLGKFSDMAMARDGTVWVTGQKGLLRSTSVTRATDRSANWEEFLPPDELQLFDFQQPFPDNEGGLVLIAELLSTHRRVAVHFNGKSWRVLPSGRENFRQAWRGGNGSFWATSISSLFVLEPGSNEFKEDSEISAGRYLDVAADANGVFWLATSDGLFRHAPPLWRVPEELQPFNSAIRSIWEDSEGRLWFANATSLAVFEAEQWKTFLFPENVESRFPLGETVFVLRDEKIVVDANDHLLVFNPETEKFKTVTHPSRQRTKPLGPSKDGGLVVQVFDAPARSTSHLEIFTGEQFQKFPGTLPTLPPETELLFIFNVRSGDLWLGTSEGLRLFRDGKWENFSSTDAMPDTALCLLEMDAERIWCGTRDQIWEFNGRSWSSVRGGFERINSLFKSRDGSIWTATSGGLFHFNNGTWIANSIEEGLPGAIITKIYEDRRGRIWTGTTRGLALFHPEADPDPPSTLIVRGSRARDGSYDVAFTGRDRWKYTPPENLLYSYRLDEQDWSMFQFERTVSFPELAAGKHYFQVRAMDRNGNITASPALLEFEIPRPWYQEGRLVFISLAGLTGVIFFAALAVNRHRRLMRSYAEVEKTVALRTKQLEEANEQLLHSQKMTALGTLSAGIAHDFNNILSIIKGSAQIIETNLEDRDKVKTRVERIKTVVEQGSGIVKAMLGFSRPSEKQITSCNLNAVVEETIQLLGDRFLREVEVKFEPDRTLPDVVVAKDFVQQILLNFIFNAADALNGRGQIVLQTGALNEMPRHVVLPAAQSERRLYISVKDAGCGIAPEVMPRIFEPFFTTKAFSSRRGTGLGLSMVYQMAKDTGCGLAVDSGIGKGSVFTLIIPLKSP